jgi:hypothetical protein
MARVPVAQAIHHLCCCCDPPPQESRLSLVPLPEARQPGSTLPTQLEVTKAPGGTFMANVPWPLNTDELIQVGGDVGAGCQCHNAAVQTIRDPLQAPKVVWQQKEWLCPHLYIITH